MFRKVKREDENKIGGKNKKEGNGHTLNSIFFKIMHKPRDNECKISF